MALQPPILPQLDNGSISTGQITADNGVIVNVPIYSNLSPGHVIRLYWNGTLIETYTIVQPTDLPKTFLVPASFTTLGNNSVYYTSIDSVGNFNQSSVVNVTIIQGSIISGYSLTAGIIINGAQAGNATGNIILYKLTYNDQPVANSYLLFTTTGGTLGVTFGQTNASGQFQLSITNNVAENVLVTATPTVATDRPNYTQVYFTQAPASYAIQVKILTNNSAANNIAQNTLEARLYNSVSGSGVGGQLLMVSANGPANYPALVSTDTQGYAYIGLTSQTAGALTVTIALQSNPAVYNQAVVTFTASYPVLLGTSTAYLYGYIGLQTFLGPYNIIVNHHYHIEPSRPPSQVRNCGAGYAFTINGNACSKSYGRYYTFLDNDMSDVIAIASGAGANLTSERYYYYPEGYAGIADIKVWDYGPYYSTASNNSLLNVTRNRTADDDGPAELFPLPVPDEALDPVDRVKVAQMEDSGKDA